MTNKPYDIIADTRKMSHADWLQMRKAGIGGSDCGSRPSSCGARRQTALHLLKPARQLTGDLC